MSDNKISDGALVRVEGVEKTFHRGGGDIHVLADLNLQVPAREFLALMGPSGSGKSTLAQFDRRTGPPHAGIGDGGRGAD